MFVFSSLTNSQTNLNLLNTAARHLLLTTTFANLKLETLVNNKFVIISVVWRFGSISKICAFFLAYWSEKFSTREFTVRSKSWKSFSSDMHRYFHVSDYVAYADVEAACTEKCPIRFGIFFQREFHQIHFANARLLEIYWGFFFGTIRTHYYADLFCSRLEFTHVIRSDFDVMMDFCRFERNWFFDGIFSTCALINGDVMACCIFQPPPVRVIVDFF